MRLVLTPRPELLTIYQGDTVVFEWDDLTPGFTESYTGEWKSPVLQSGQVYTFTFAKPGTYVYRSTITNGGPSFPGVIQVQPLTGPHPSIWISSPLDNSIVNWYGPIQAEVTNSAAIVKSVDFYAGSAFVGRATNAPYKVMVDFGQRPGTYEFTAVVVDTQGQTNASPPVRITFGDRTLYCPWRLPGGQTVFFMAVTGGGPWCLLWSEDLTTWNSQLIRQRKGDNVIVDETTTNVVQRFYRIQDCL